MNLDHLWSFEQSLEIDGRGRKSRRRRWEGKNGRRGKPASIFWSYSEKYPKEGQQKRTWCLFRLLLMSGARELRQKCTPVVLPHSALSRE